MPATNNKKLSISRFIFSKTLKESIELEGKKGEEESDGGSIAILNRLIERLNINLQDEVEFLSISTTNEGTNYIFHIISFQLNDRTTNLELTIKEPGEYEKKGKNDIWYVMCELSDEPAFSSPIQKMAVVDEQQGDDEQENLFDVSVSLIQNKLKQHLMHKEGTEIKRQFETFFNSNLQEIGIFPTSKLKLIEDYFSGTTIEAYYSLKVRYRDEPATLNFYLENNVLACDVKYLTDYYGTSFRPNSRIVFQDYDYDFKDIFKALAKSIKVEMDRLYDGL